MPINSTPNQETLLIETMLSALDARESACGAGSMMLTYLADLLVQRAREEIEGIRSTTRSPDPSRTENDNA